MQLYIFPPSPSSLRVQAVAEHLGLELELITIDLTQGEQMNPDFIKVNPNHEIPVLVDGDFTVWESNAIVTYLADKEGGGDLIPVDIKDKAHMLQWMTWNTSHFSSACINYVFERRLKQFLGIGEPDPDQLTGTHDTFHRFATVLNDHLKGREALAGDAYTLADYVVGSFFVHTLNAEPLQDDEEYVIPGMTTQLRSEEAQLPLDDYADIRRWSAGIVSTPGWKKALGSIKKKKG